MSLSNEMVQEKLIAKFGDQVSQFATSYGMLSFESPKEINLKVLQFLYDEPSLEFTFLTDICAVNYPNQKGAELVVVYHLHNLKENIRVRYSVSTSLENTDVYTATKLFESANWMERETYDFFGINFVIISFCVVQRNEQPTQNQRRSQCTKYANRSKIHDIPNHF